MAFFLNVDGVWRHFLAREDQVAFVGDDPLDALTLGELHGAAVMDATKEIIRQAAEESRELPLYQATPSDEQMTTLGKAMTARDGGLIDIDEDNGRMTTSYLRDLQRDLRLSYVPEHWTEAKLAAWFCRQIHDPSITHASKRAFASGWIAGLLAKEGFDLARVNRQKFLLRNLISQQVDGLWKDAVATERNWAPVAEKMAG